MRSLTLAILLLTKAALAAEPFLDEPLQVRDPASASDCVAPSGALCVRAADASTIEAASMPTAGLVADARTHVPTFARNAAARDLVEPAWALDVVFRLRRAALAGNAVFLAYDADDVQSIAAREPVALWQAPVKGGRVVAARLTLTDDDGFRVDHTYRIRLVQLVGGHEVLLAEGDVRLH